MIIKWVGGKTKLAQWIMSNLPRGEIFVDVFGGSGAVIDAAITRFGQKRCRFVYNDLDERVYSFFKVLRDQSDELIRLVDLTPYSRQCFEQAYLDLNEPERYCQMDAVHRALSFFIVNRQGFGAKMEPTWSLTRDGEVNYKTWQTLPEKLLLVAEKWKSVFLENKDYKKIIEHWDSPDTSFYLDPPYENVEVDYYEVNKTLGFNHVEMQLILSEIKGSYCVSYYGGDSPTDDSPLVKSYVERGCHIHRTQVSKHLSTLDTKETATELLIIKDNGHARFGDVKEKTKFL